MISMNNVSKWYGSFQVLTDCSTEVAKGEVEQSVSTDRKSTRLNSSHDQISYAVFCLKKKKKNKHDSSTRKKKHINSSKYNTTRSILCFTKRLNNPHAYYCSGKT